MKFTTTNPLRSVNRNDTTLLPAHTPEALSEEIRTRHPETIQSAQAVMHLSLIHI